MNEKHSEPELIRNKFDLKGTDILPTEPNMSSNINIPTLFADIISIMSRSDGISVLRFFSRMPGANIEICRIAVPQNVIKSFIDMTCQVSGYYPEAKKEENKK